MNQRHARRPSLDPATVFAQIAALHQATADTLPPTPQAGSPLADNDARLGIHYLSHPAAMAAGVAIDNLEAVRNLVQDAGVVHPWAEHTLLRAAFESACTALWLLGPDDPLERHYRGVKHALDNVRQGNTANTLGGADRRPSGKSHQDVIDEVMALVPDDDPSGRGRWDHKRLTAWSYKNVVREASAHMGQPADLFELVWRRQSGLAHGTRWATMSTLEKDIVDGDTLGVATVRFTASVEDLVPVIAMTLAVVRRALQRYSELSSAPSNEN